ncbi:MAG TPA: ATP synthase F0 subunit B [Candidatus Acidoferrales bacterium]|nr:ATP synthase F0 subunit B [Candidatus Acidoferrales bacterium]
MNRSMLSALSCAIARTLAVSRRVARLASSIAAVLFALALCAAPLLAATNPEEAAGTTTGWVYRWINFGIFVAVLVWVFAKKTPAYFRGRQDAIAAAIAESARAREEAERQQREAETKMAMLDATVAELRARAKRESAVEAERIRALAKEDAKRIELAGQVEIRAAERAAEMELKTIAARVAIDRAETLLEQQMTPHADASLFGGFVAELAGSAN